MTPLQMYDMDDSRKASFISSFFHVEMLQRWDTCSNITPDRSTRANIVLKIAADDQREMA